MKVTPSDFEELHPCSDHSPASGLQGLREEHPHLVGRLLPEGFSAYARILHPAYRWNHDKDGQPIDESIVKWAEVARWAGRKLSLGASFNDISRRQDGIEWTNPAGAQMGTSSPLLGSLDVETYRRVTEVLQHFTGSPEEAYGCLWAGYGFMEQPTAWPELHTPGREYILFTGSLGAFRAMVESPIAAQSPNILWPADRSWYLATDVDLDATYLAGAEDCIRSLLGDSQIEATPATLQDPI